MNIQGTPAELHFTLTIQRATGETETIPMVGRVNPDQSTKEQTNGSDALNGGAQRSD